MIFYLRRHPALQVRNFVYFLANSNYDTLIVFSVSCQQVPEPIKQVESSLHSNCCILRANLGYTVVWIMSQRILIHLRGTFPSLSAVTGFLRLTQSWLPSQISQTAFLFPEILNRHKVSQKIILFCSNTKLNKRGCRASCTSSRGTDILSRIRPSRAQE